MNSIFVVKNTSNSHCWSFSLENDRKSFLYLGKYQNSHTKNKEYLQSFDSSSFFSTSWYGYLSETLSSKIVINVYGSIEKIDSSIFTFLSHIGPLLLAIDEKDSLLTAELFHRCKSIYIKFIPIITQIIENIAPEALFSWIWGRIDNRAYTKLANFINSHGRVPVEQWDVSEMFFYAARRTLLPYDYYDKNTYISPDQLMIIYISKVQNFHITLGLVGSNYHPWIINNFKKIDMKIKKAACLEKANGTEFSDSTRKMLFGNASVTVQAEPYNSFDRNAIGVYISDIFCSDDDHISKSHAGYIRSTGAAIIRKARNDKILFPATLSRIGNYSEGRNGIVVAIDI